ALIAFAIFVLAGGGRAQALLVSILSALGLVAGLASPAGQVLLRRFLDPQESASWFVRLEIWKVGWTRFLAKPWTGIGLNQGQFVGDQVGVADAHNVVLQALMEQGILGGIMTVGILVGTLRLAARSWPTGVPGSALKGVRRAILGVCVAVLLN